MSCFHLMLLLFTSIASAAGPYFPSFKDCAPFTCGNSIIQYPFGPCGPLDAECSGPCGPLYAECSDDHQITLSGYGSHTGWEGRVVGEIAKSSYSTGTLQITSSYIDLHPYDGNDYSSGYDWLSKGGFFNLSHADTLGTIVNCTQQPADILFNGSLIKRLDCTESNRYCFFYPQAGFGIPSCDNYPIVVPTNKTYNISADKDFEQLHQRGFQIKWSIHDHTCDSCKASGGRCYSDFEAIFDIGQQNYDPYCICPDDDVHRSDCNDGIVIQYGKRLSAKNLAAIFIAVCAVFSIVVVCCIMVRRRSCCCRRNSREQQQSIRAFMDSADSRPPSVENFLNYYSAQAPARYSYSQIITYTNNLAQKLGKGGFGTVYRGKLPNGHLIAVKILDESKQCEQQFIAEVATVGTTCHINLVRLLGYCSQGCKRALVYEYMVNGSLDEYIHGDHKEEMDWKQLFSIAVGTARGIAYLHDDCRNRILHCDIKPPNILLDANFLPKVADFGLAKISDREESHVSVANRGTLGYAAPEMWSRLYGVVTDKSDVYSYGILLMEMVGRRKNIDYKYLESNSKFCYAEWAFKQVEKGEFENLRKEDMSEEDQVIAKRLGLVGLWCIQFKASRRPSMSKVVQMLEGDVDITTPPFPFPMDTPLQPSSSSSASEIQMVDPSSHSEVQMVHSSRRPSMRKVVQILEGDVPPFPFPVDTHLPLQGSSSHQSSSSSQSLDIQMTDFISTETAEASR